ncbi:periplasmic heavy metal sensor [Kordiimonas lacus]|uniref:Uncharacterized membrane protein n=1 Tax=Kordiimonas lacus TaxID=637679 RepID=A0A1G6TRI6_9PROT|nr:periplasmic heavy metal sensor [Kordiimonas lacus]SDD31524.1 Uncharacterized membrane protein [Kordiimonas lacus]
MTGKMKWILVLLAASLAVNLFIGGVMLGRQIRGEEGPMGSPRERVEFNLRRLASYLPESEQDQLRMIMRDHRQKLRGHFREMRVSEQRIKDLLLAETVDLSALEAALDSHQTKAEELKAPLRDIILNVVAKLDQETRKALADDLFERRRPGPDGRPPRRSGVEGFPYDRRPPPPLRDDEGLDPDDRPPPPPGA